MLGPIPCSLYTSYFHLFSYSYHTLLPMSLSAELSRVEVRKKHERWDCTSTSTFHATLRLTVLCTKSLTYSFSPCGCYHKAMSKLAWAETDSRSDAHHHSEVQEHSLCYYTSRCVQKPCLRYLHSLWRGQGWSFPIKKKKCNKKLATNSYRIPCKMNV